MRILFLFHSGSGFGGAFQLYRPILAELARRGHAFTIGAPAGPAHERLASDGHATRVTYDGYFPLDFEGRAAREARMSHRLNAALLEECLAAESFDLVVSNSGAIRYASEVSRVPHLQFLQETFTPERWRRRLERRHPPSAYAGPSERLLTRDAGRPFFPLPYPRPPGEPVDEIATRIRHGIPPGACVIGMVGTLSRHKAQAEVVRRFSELPAQTDDGRPVHLVLIGPAADAEYQAEIRQARRGNDRVHVVGSIANPAERAALFDVYVLASQSEGLPLTLLDALDAGKPAVSFAVGVVDEVLRDEENGLLAPAGDFAALEKRLTRFLSDAVLRETLTAGARRRSTLAAYWCDLPEVADRYEEAFRQAAELPPPPRGRTPPSPAKKPPAVSARRILFLQSARPAVLAWARRAVGEAWPDAEVTLLRHADAVLPDVPRARDLVYPTREPFRTEVLRKVAGGSAYDLAVVPLNHPAGRGYGRIFDAARELAKRAVAYAPPGAWTDLSK